MKPASPEEAILSNHIGLKGDWGRLEGVALRIQEEMKKKIEKWQEKGPAKQGRVLPVPDMEPKKRRGGKRARKYKERYGLTDTKKVRPPSCTPPPVQDTQQLRAEMPCSCYPSSRDVPCFAARCSTIVCTPQ
jgi:hypothetical protein